jgi:hypothetical protein
MDLASSVAGLLGLAGLAVQSASTLYTFCRKIPQVAGEVQAIINEVGRLSETIKSIQQVVSDRTTQKSSPRTFGVIAKLQDEITRCMAGLEVWTASMAALEMENGKRAKNMIKKLKLAADVGRFSDMRLKISSHREQLALLVELLTMYSIISYIVDWRANDNRDLEMSTSLDLQAIDSKVDNFTTKQTSSQQITDSHFEKIQERVQIFQALQHTTHEATLEVSRSTDKIHQTLHDIRVSQASSQQATHLQADRLDATLATIQRSLLNMAHSAHSRPRSRRTGRKMRHSRPIMESESEDCGDSSMQGVFSELVQRTAEPAIIPSQLNRLVDLVVTVRYRCGKAHFEALAIPDLEFEAAGVETKLRMIKYLQDLRLLLWLLYRKEHVCKGSFEFARFSRSEFISEAGLVSSWTF